MSIVDIDLSRFDYASEIDLEELLKEPTELDETVVVEHDFFKLPVSDAYKNNQERIKREEELAKLKEENDKNNNVIISSEK
jgi:hypothetical protein